MPYRDADLRFLTMLSIFHNSFVSPPPRPPSLFNLASLGTTFPSVTVQQGRPGYTTNPTKSFKITSKVYGSEVLQYCYRSYFGIVFRFMVYDQIFKWMAQNFWAIQGLRTTFATKIVYFHSSYDG